MTIRSNPPGALVYVDGYEVGTTPISTNFTYYGTRSFQLIKDGYQTVTENRSIPPPWYQVTPLDFVTENLVPGQIRDQHTIDFQLMPQLVIPAEQIRQRGESLRAQAQRTGIGDQGLGLGAAPDTAPMSNPQP